MRIIIFEATLPVHFLPTLQRKCQEATAGPLIWATHSASCHQLLDWTACQLTLGLLSAQMVEAETLLTLLPCRTHWLTKASSKDIVVAAWSLQKPYLAGMESSSMTQYVPNNLSLSR